MSSATTRLAPAARRFRAPQAVVPSSAALLLPSRKMSSSKP